MRSSRLPAVKTLAEFDFAFQPSIKREQIESRARARLRRARRERRYCSGRPGVGKTGTWRSAWPCAAAESGRRVYYGQRSRILVESLMEAKTSGNLARRLKVLTHPATACGRRDRLRLPMTQAIGAILFFQLINARHERASTVRDVEQAGSRTGAACSAIEVMAAPALLDPGCCTTATSSTCRGNSYRMRAAQGCCCAPSSARTEDADRNGKRRDWCQTTLSAPMRTRTAVDLRSLSPGI